MLGHVSGVENECNRLISEFYAYNESSTRRRPTPHTPESRRADAYAAKYFIEIIGDVMYLCWTRVQPAHSPYGRIGK